MQFYGALILFVTLSAAWGLRCYSCIGESCTNKITCSPLLDRCSTTNLNGMITKTCMASYGCSSNVKCCDTDLCNSTTPTGSSVLLLLVSSAIITVFL